MCRYFFLQILAIQPAAIIPTLRSRSKSKSNTRLIIQKRIMCKTTSIPCSAIHVKSEAFYQLSATAAANYPSPYTDCVQHSIYVHYTYKAYHHFHLYLLSLGFRTSSPNSPILYLFITFDFFHYFQFYFDFRNSQF